MLVGCDLCTLVMLLWRSTNSFLAHNMASVDLVVAVFEERRYREGGERERESKYKNEKLHRSIPSPICIDSRWSLS